MQGGREGRKAGSWLGGYRCQGHSEVVGPDDGMSVGVPRALPVGVGVYSSGQHGWAGGGRVGDGQGSGTS